MLLLLFYLLHFEHKGEKIFITESQGCQVYKTKPAQSTRPKKMPNHIFSLSFDPKRLNARIHKMS